LNSFKIDSANTSGRSLLAEGVRVIPMISRKILSGDSYIYADLNPEFIIFIIGGKYYFSDISNGSGSDCHENLKDFLSVIESEY